MGIKKNKNDSFLLYANTLDVIEQLPMEVRNKATLVIFDYGAGKEVKDPFITIDGETYDLRKFFRQIFNGIDIEKRRFANKELINKVQEKMMYLMTNWKDAAVRKEAEKALADLKKLYNEVRKHDVEDVPERIQNIIDRTPNATILQISSRESQNFRAKLISGWNEYLSEADRKTLSTLIKRAEDKKAEADRLLRESQRAR